MTGSRIGQRVIGIDAIDLGGLEQQLRFDLDGAQRGGGISGEKRVAGAGREDDHATLFQVAHRATADVVLAHFVDTDRRHHARVHVHLFERILHRQRVHDSGQHAHLIGRDAIHTGACQAGAAENIAAANDHRQLNAQRLHLTQFGRDAFEHQRVDTVIAAAQQRFARELDQHALHVGS